MPLLAPAPHPMILFGGVSVLCCQHEHHKQKGLGSFLYLEMMANPCTKAIAGEPDGGV